jgi:CBS domain-containing protein
MQAADIMTRDVITARPDDSVRNVAQVLLKNRISAMPVLDAQDRVIGVVSEGDLLRRAEIGTDQRRSWWRDWLAGRERLARDYVRAHGRKVSDIMTSPAISATPDTELVKIASLMEKNGIKRLPVVEEGRLVGLISRADMLRAFAELSGATVAAPTVADEQIRKRLNAELGTLRWLSPGKFNVAVDHGVVDLWAAVESEAERKALVVAAETTPGVTGINSHVYVGPIPSGM